MRYDFPILSYGRSADSGIVPSCPTSTPSMVRRTSSIRSRTSPGPSGPSASRNGEGQEVPETRTPPSLAFLSPSFLRRALLSRVCVHNPRLDTLGTVRGPTMPTILWLVLSLSWLMLLLLFSSSPFLLLQLRADRSMGLASSPSSVMRMKCKSTSVGMMYPMFEPPRRWLEATPITLPCSSKTGPPPFSTEIWKDKKRRN
mmetsp:Transcript_41479/g.81302  ORF Transcript_41479/g.81302 Transcript_41479/m.81302 type:complete len:200 (-) Transcript_41479:201-800(-)